MNFHGDGDDDDDNDCSRLIILLWYKYFVQLRTLNNIIK
jgi:hypothetical protein